jgi:soluble lytic murein transglycosylase-like protein
VAAYAPSLTEEEIQEINRQECLQMKQYRFSGKSMENVTIPQQNSMENVIKYYEVPLSQEIQDYIFKLCEQYELSVSLVIALIDLESEGTFDNNLICENTNGSKDIGIMQLNSKNFVYFGELINEPNFDAKNIYHNLQAGIKYLSILKEDLKDKYSDEELRIRYLNSYNMGVNGYKRFVKKTGKINRAYSDRILKKRDQYQKQIEKEIN